MSKQTKASASSSSTPSSSTQPSPSSATQPGDSLSDIRCRVEKRKVVSGERWFLRVKFPQGGGAHTGPCRLSADLAEADCAQLVSAFKKSGMPGVVAKLEEIRGMPLQKCTPVCHGTSRDHEGRTLDAGIRYKKYGAGGFYAAIRVSGKEIRVPTRESEEGALDDRERLLEERAHGYDDTQKVARAIRRERGLPASRLNLKPAQYRSKMSLPTGIFLAGAGLTPARYYCVVDGPRVRGPRRWTVAEAQGDRNRLLKAKQGGEEKVLETLGKLRKAAAKAVPAPPRRGRKRKPQTSEEPPRRRKRRCEASDEEASEEEAPEEEAPKAKAEPPKQEAVEVEVPEVGKDEEKESSSEEEAPKKNLRFDWNELRLGLMALPGRVGMRLALETALLPDPQALLRLSSTMIQQQAGLLDAAHRERYFAALKWLNNEAPEASADIRSALKLRAR